MCFVQQFSQNLASHFLRNLYLEKLFTSKQQWTELTLTEVIASHANDSTFVWDTFVTPVSRRFVGAYTTLNVNFEVRKGLARYRVLVQTNRTSSWSDQLIATNVCVCSPYLSPSNLNPFPTKGTTKPVQHRNRQNTNPPTPMDSRCAQPSSISCGRAWRSGPQRINKRENKWCRTG